MYGAEMWAPFIWMVAVAEGTRDPVNTAYFKWLKGLGGARLERSRGWTPVRELDDKALLAAARVFEDARKFQGLLGRAVHQLVLNWEHTRDSKRSERTWMGALLSRVHVVWPRFRVQFSHPVSWTGAPMLRVETKFSLARQFHTYGANACVNVANACKSWRSRQISLRRVSSKPAFDTADNGPVKVCQTSTKS